MASELTLIHGVPPDCNEREFLRELQNALLWINFRFYLAPLFWFIVGGPWGPVTLVGYAFLRAWQTWLARYQTPHQRLQSGIDAILHVLDWIPVRLAGVVYALLGHGEKALPAWFASLADLHTSQYQVLTRLAQFSLARETHTDKVETPKAAVSMAKKASFVVVVIIAMLTLYGAAGVVRFIRLTVHIVSRVSAASSADASGAGWRVKGSERICRWDAEIRHSMLIPANQLQAGMTVGIVQRIAFYFSIVSGVINQYLFTVWRGGEAIVTGTKLTIFNAGGKNRTW
ncbi:AmpE protein [Salmonella enterica subsp. indica]|uniref:AmpE protein n=1 Tax=Salmonella enterica subsp. indica TaxID=59207 RepID=A0A379XV26_SALER|nr:AmpE protein [Salmonella enterica subsp. indica]